MTSLFEKLMQQPTISEWMMREILHNDAARQREAYRNLSEVFMTGRIKNTPPKKLSPFEDEN
jgi:hypothetical protein